MIRLFVFIFCLGLVLSSQVDWVHKAKVPDPSGYFRKVVQQLVYDLEKREWCNLKIDGYVQNLDAQLYNWHVNGKATYSNGFVISIQRIDTFDFEQNVEWKTVNGKRDPHAVVQGKLNMHNVKIGFDVLVELVNPKPPHAPVQRYTGQITHELIQLQLDVTRNLLTKEMTSNPRRLSLSVARATMIYMPANNMTEALSREYKGYWNTDGVTLWCRNIIGPMLVDISTNKIEFPELCFSNCPR